MITLGELSSLRFSSAENAVSTSNFNDFLPRRYGLAEMWSLTYVYVIEAKIWLKLFAFTVWFRIFARYIIRKLARLYHITPLWITVEIDKKNKRLLIFVSRASCQETYKENKII